MRRLTCVQEGDRRRRGSAKGGEERRTTLSPQVEEREGARHPTELKAAGRQRLPPLLRRRVDPEEKKRKF